MSAPLLVKISRDGKEIGTYEAQEAVRLLVYGTLKWTDFYWHEGMTEWAPLLKLQASEARRQLAERADQLKQEEAIKSAKLAMKRREEAEQLRQAKEEEDRAVAQAVRIRTEEEKAKAKQNEDAISIAVRALWVKKMASERLDEAGGCFKAIGVGFLLIGGAVLLKALGGDDDGSAIRQQVRTLQMTNGILLMILGCIIAKR